MKRKREQPKQFTRLKSQRARKLQYRKKSDESSQDYENRLEELLTPLSDIYKKIDRWEQRSIIDKDIYYTFNTKIYDFFQKEFSERNDIAVCRYNLAWGVYYELDSESFKRCFDGKIPISEARIRKIDNKGVIHKKRDSHIEEIQNFVINSMKDSNIQLVVLPFSIYVEIYEKGSELKKLTQKMLDERRIVKGDVKRHAHKCMIIINKFLKTIEFFDSNGGEFHIDYTWNEDELAAANFLISLDPILDTYTLRNTLDTCPNPGFQYYEARAVDINKWKKEKGIGGFCIIWSIFTAYMRVKYYYLDSDHLIKAIINKIKSKEDETTSNQAFHKFITNFLMYMKHVLEI